MPCRAVLCRVNIIVVWGPQPTMHYGDIFHGGFFLVSASPQGVLKGHSFGAHSSHDRAGPFVRSVRVYVCVYVCVRCGSASSFLLRGQQATLDVGTHTYIYTRSRWGRAHLRVAVAAHVCCQAGV